MLPLIMDPTKKRQQPDSGFDEGSSSDDGDVPNWRAGLGLPPGLRRTNRNEIAKHIHQNPYAEEIPAKVASTTARKVEKEFYKKATSEHDYLTRVSDFILRIQRTPGILQAARVDLTSQMGDLDNSKLFFDDITVDDEDLPEELKKACNDYLQTVCHPLRKLQKQPLPGFHSDGNAVLPPEQQPQQQQLGPNEHQTGNFLRR